MTDAQLPADVLALIHGPVGTMAHVETLLVLRACEPEPRSLDTLAEATHAPSPAAARQTLAELAAARLVAPLSDDGWVYAPRDAATRESVDHLARMYDERPVTLVRALYSRPSRPLQSFADAFRLRGGD